MVLVRPKHSDHDLEISLRELEEEKRLLRAERQGGIEITRQRETDVIDDRGNEEEITEIRRQERKGKPFLPLKTDDILTMLPEPRSKVMRAMFATLT